MNASRENFVKSAVLVIKEYVGINLSYDKVDEILGDKMKDEWTNFDYSDVSTFMDTSPREDVMDFVAFHYLDRYWPTYGESANMEAFMSNLISAAESDINYE
jgi:hypothetical protein